MAIYHRPICAPNARIWALGKWLYRVNGKLRDELLNREVFTTLTEAKILIEA
jgi:hypothetical protein